MLKSYKEVKKSISPEVLKLAKAKSKKMLQDLPLQELRHARQLSQE